MDSPDICKAIMENTYNGNSKCYFRAKYNGYCGKHCSQAEGIELNFCKGITKCGVNCKKIVKYGQFCNIHKHSEKPDNLQFLLYEPDVEWPYLENVLHWVKKCNNGKDLDKRIKYINETVNMYYHGIISDQEQRERNNRLVMIKIEMIFRNFFIDYNTEHWQAVIKELQEYIAPYGFLKKYRELFRKKFDQSYRTENQKNYVEKVLAQSNLGNNLANKIVNSI
jgi:hypothetical protein